MTLSEAQNILMSDPTPEDVERVAREYSRENPSSESIRTPDGKSELMAFALSGWDDEVPTQYSYKQHAWTKIGDAAGDPQFVTVVRVVAGADSAAKRALRDAGYVIVGEHYIEDEPDVSYLLIEGAHSDEFRNKFWNEDWYAGYRIISKNAPFAKSAHPVTDAADSELAQVTRALKKAFASFEHPQKEDWEVRTRRYDSGRIWVMLFRPWNSVFHAFDVTPGKDSFEIRESEYAKKLRKSGKPAFFSNLLPLFTDALKSVKVVERA